LAQQQAEDVIEMPEPLGIYAQALLQRAGEFVDAFEALTGNRLRAEHPFPSYFLMAHGLELLFKAHLAANGHTKKQLSNVSLRHHPAKLKAKCDEAGLASIEHLSELANVFDEMNRHHDFRYPTSYILHLPNPVTCLLVARQLQAAIEPLIASVGVDAQLQFASETRHLKGKKIRWSD